MKTKLLETKLHTPANEELAESLEERLRKATETGELIDDGAEIVYTERKDGVLPQYDVRTDKWDVAMQAMDAATKAQIAQTEAAIKIEQEHDSKNKDKDTQE